MTDPGRQDGMLQAGYTDGDLLQVHHTNGMAARKYPPHFGRFRFDERILALATAGGRRPPADHRQPGYD